jgi:hypothetical protein
MRASELKRLIGTVQSAYFVTSGIWPILHIRSFEWVSGPKVDRWLVKTVGALITVIGATIGLSASRHRVTPEIELLATGSAVSLGLIDVIYVAKRRIRWVYLLDAVAEFALATAWAFARTGALPRAETPD